MARTNGGTEVSGESRTGGPMLEEAVKLLPSPLASPTERSPERHAEVRAEMGRQPSDLRAVISLLPTPTRNNDRQATAKNPRNGPGTSPTLGDLEHEWSTSVSTGESTPERSSGGKPSSDPRLSPSFVEWMMGAPAGWTDPDCPLSATEFKCRLERSSADTSPSSRQEK